MYLEDLAKQARGNYKEKYRKAMMSVRESHNW